MAIGPEFPSVLGAAQAGAEWAWRALYRDLAPAVLGYLRNRGASSADDVCGEVFCEVVRSIGRFEGNEQAFRAWVFLIARHRAIDEQRRARRRPEAPMPFVGDAIASRGDQTEAEALSRIETEDIEQILSALPPAQREVVLLRVIAGLDVTEVAKIMGKRPGSVRVLHHRALQALRDLLGSRNAIEAHDGS